MLLTWLLTLGVLQAGEANTHIVVKNQKALVGMRKRRDASFNLITEVLGWREAQRMMGVNL